MRTGVDRLTALCGGVTAVGMVATPLAAPGGPTRRRLASVVVGGLAATTATRSAGRWGGRRTIAAFGAVAGITAIIERVGTATGVPFGRYRYTSALRPQLAHVPVLVPIAWFAMAVPARAAARSAMRAVGVDVSSRRPLGSVAAAAALTAWDLFLDPQMVGEGYWRWARRGRYRGIPVSNFVGWFLTALVVMAILDRTLPPDDDPDPVLVGEYAAMAAMETLGFAAFFGDRLVAAVGGSAMGPIAALAIAGSRSSLGRATLTKPTGRATSSTGGGR